MHASMSAAASPALRDGDEVLLLCHRIPYPPDKGDKIRSYRWLTALAQRYRVHLGAFVDDARDWEHAEPLRRLCDEVCLRPLPPLRARLRALRALLTGAPLTIACYRDAAMAAWTRELLARRPVGCVVLYSSAMAQYAQTAEGVLPRHVIDYVDVDADKWRQYAERSRAPMAWLYARESRRLLAYDAQAAQAACASLFVSSPEAALFRRLTGVTAPLTALPNGVDHEFFAPATGRGNPFAGDRPAIVFTGAMDYWANVDAVRWFATAVWPKVQAAAPAARFCVVGARPSGEVLALAGDDILVTGRVPDVRPYLQHAAAVVAPMRIARGIQNKILEGMAMARPVVTTTMGLEGIEAVAGQHLLVADEPVAMAERIAAVLRGAHAGLGPAARALVSERYNWSAAKARFLDAVTGESEPAQVDA
ncbi:TIGR03087 family PEP-CTERM/XrtA system glycosyltransferase [uncultured Thiohalocapsa sp.]|uniref:TIGR03087 family PEP-CTERM/XrtA system glycosyltransferase n=1 Tax=uncultured Thiohalocapsa sp. TaxID=768990 RepID=UPI0025E43538|nr:TIGR03087 family PEP-CTERM/XrtA system glycosyltransferase [uncultured Thiohalocapsa sp.]